MGRPKRPFNGVEDIVARTTDRWHENEATKRLGTRVRNRWNASTHWHYRAPNGLYDPLTYLHVLDSIIQINPDIELRTSNLVGWLNENKIAFAWDVITTGKVLMDISDAFTDALEGMNGAGNRQWSLLVPGKDYRGNFYRITINSQTIDLAYGVRHDLMDLSALEMGLRARGERTQRLTSPLDECATLRNARPNWTSTDPGAWEDEEAV